MDQNVQIIDNILKSNKLKFFKYLNEDCSDDLYKNKINDLIIYFENIDKQNKDVNVFESDINNRLAKIDQIAYRKPWNKLSKIQREIKLKEFINTFLLKSASNYNDIKNLLLKEFDNNKLNSSKVVNYEPYTSKIIGINKLNFDTESNKYLF